MKPGVIMTMLVGCSIFIGCQSGLYKSEIKSGSDGKTAAMKYRVVETIPTDPEQIDDTMPITVTKQREEHSDNSTGLCVLTLGIIPAFYDSWVDYSITVDSPIGKQSGTARLSAKSWIGWICLIPYPGFGDERPDDPKLPSKDREDKLCETLVQQLVSKYNAKDYDAFVASSKEKVLAEQKRVASRKEQLQKMIDAGEIDAVLSACETEMKQTGKDSPWKEIVSSAESKYVELVNDKIQWCIDAKRYCEAVKTCDASRKRIGNDKWWMEKRKEIANSLASHAGDVADGGELVECFSLIDDRGAKELIVMRLNKLSQVDKLDGNELFELVKDSREEVVLAAINGNFPKEKLAELINPARGSRIVNAAMKRLGDLPEAWRIVAKSLKTGQQSGIPYDLMLLNAFTNAYNSEQDILYLVNVCEKELTDALGDYILKVKNTSKIKDALKEARLVAEEARIERERREAEFKAERAKALLYKSADDIIDGHRSLGDLDLGKAKSVLEGIGDPAVRTGVVEEVFRRLALTKRENDKQVVLCWGAFEGGQDAKFLLDRASKEFVADIFHRLLSGEYKVSATSFGAYGSGHAFSAIWERVSEVERKSALEQTRARAKSAKGPVFAGFYLGMPDLDFFILSEHLGVSPDRANFTNSNYTDGFTFSRSECYKMFQYEEDEFWESFLKECMPPNSRNNKWSWSDEYSENWNEWYLLYRSMKHNIQVLYGKKSGRLQILPARQALE